MIVKGSKALKQSVVNAVDKVKSWFSKSDVVQDVRHAVPNSNVGESVLNGINPQYFNPNSRFGGGLIKWLARN